MFTLVLSWGIFTYSLLVLGWAGWLTKTNIGVMNLGYLLFLVGLVYLKLKSGFSFKKLKKSGYILLAIIFISAEVNLIGAIGPELGFDALWYHLTIPRIWLLQQKIFFIPGGFFYYSLLPKNIELSYLSLLPFVGQIGPKLMSWGFGLAGAWVTYKISRQHLNTWWSLLAAVIFYTNLVVGWQSITSYVDLGRTFFEGLAFLYLIQKKYSQAGITLGLAVCSKFLSVGSVPIFIIIGLIQKANWKQIGYLAILPLLLALPWFEWSYLQTGNPIYPIFGGYDLTSIKHGWDVLAIWLFSPDPISPIYFLTFPWIIYYCKKLDKSWLAYCVLSLGVWWIIPRTGGGRFLLPYLPVFSALVAAGVATINTKAIQKTLVVSIFIVCLFNVGYRFLANAKYLPVIFHWQTQDDFLQKNLYKEGHNFYYLPDERLRKLYE